MRNNIRCYAEPKGRVMPGGGRAVTDHDLVGAMLADDWEEPSLGDLGSFPPHGRRRTAGNHGGHEDGKREQTKPALAAPQPSGAQLLARSSVLRAFRVLRG